MLTFKRVPITCKGRGLSMTGIKLNSNRNWNVMLTFCFTLVKFLVLCYRENSYWHKVHNFSGILRSSPTEISWGFGFIDLWHDSAIPIHAKLQLMSMGPLFTGLFRPNHAWIHPPLSMECMHSAGINFMIWPFVCPYLCVNKNL